MSIYRRLRISPEHAACHEEALRTLGKPGQIFSRIDRGLGKKASQRHDAVGMGLLFVIGPHAHEMYCTEFICKWYAGDSRQGCHASIRKTRLTFPDKELDSKCIDLEKTEPHVSFF